MANARYDRARRDRSLLMSYETALGRGLKSWKDSITDESINQSSDKRLRFSREALERPKQTFTLKLSYLRDQTQTKTEP